MKVLVYHVRAREGANHLQPPSPGGLPRRPAMHGPLAIGADRRRRGLARGFHGPESGAATVRIGPKNNFEISAIGNTLSLPI